ncbi:MAG: NAD-dependent epimerase/dehydratase family protein [Solirubrobacterales bacterium]|nr:NAD-dependent epimerase/dehydratase family protein [Solirubrobacterales bacterium]
MRALVTGATGKVGHAVARALADRGDEVVALVRDPDRAAAVLPEGVRAVGGDVGDPASVGAAAEGCELAFNAMGLPEQWLADPEEFMRVNARGSETVVVEAARAGVRRVVHTSTIDVFDAAPGARFDESRVAGYPKGTVYERSKQEADRLVLAAADREGVEVVFANPAAVYGPGPQGSASPERDILRPVVEGRVAAVPALPPGGFGMLFSDGAAAGHLLAAERGEPGERYILCDGHVSLRELAEIAVGVAGRGRVPPVMPTPLARALAAAGEPLARLTRKPPLLPKGQLHFLLWNAQPDSTKAQRDLGWQPTPIEDGVRATLRSMGLLDG